MPLPHSTVIPPIVDHTKENSQPKLSEKEKQVINQIKCIQIFSETEAGDSPCILTGTTKGTLFRHQLSDDPEKVKTGIVLFQDHAQRLISDFTLTKSFKFTEEGHRIIQTVLLTGNGDIVILEITCKGAETISQVIHE